MQRKGNKLLIQLCSAILLFLRVPGMLPQWNVI